MASITINDLEDSQELDRKALADIGGGRWKLILYRRIKYFVKHGRLFYRVRYFYRWKWC